MCGSADNGGVGTGARNNSGANIPAAASTDKTVYDGGRRMCRIAASALNNIKADAETPMSKRGSSRQFAASETAWTQTAAGKKRGLRHASAYPIPAAVCSTIRTVMTDNCIPIC